jgi:glycerate 2-kinase
MPRMDDTSARQFLRELFSKAIASADPFVVLPPQLPDKPKGRCIVVGAGKASAAMAAALEQAWPDVALSGVVVTRYGHAVPTQRIKIIEAAHPIPDENSMHAAQEILSAVAGLDKDDMVIALMSGGGSALMVSPLRGMTLNDKQSINRALLKSGAGIGEMNVVRKHLSLIKGGKLALAARPARVVTLVISDVPGDDPATIASGPTVYDMTTAADSLEILRRYKIDIAPHVLESLQATQKPSAFAADVRVIASPLLALRAAAEHATSVGITPLILGDALEGEAREVGKVLAAMALSAQSHGTPIQAPCVLLSGGETTVTIGGDKAGRGGRNTELILSTAIHLNGRIGIWALAGDTDGIDGTEDAAGAIISPDTLSRSQAKNIGVRQVLDNHDSYAVFKALDDLVLTGPTLTNVNDFRALLVCSAT